MPRTSPRLTNSSPIARRRMALGLTQAQLAEQIGCKPAEIGHWETGRRLPRIDTLQKIADALNCSILDIMPTKNTP